MRDKDFWQLLEKGNTVDIALAIHNGANINGMADERKSPMLVRAARHERYDIVDTLLAFGANVNVVDHNNYTALHYAAIEQGNEDACRLLLEAGINPSHKVDGLSLLCHVAVYESERASLLARYPFNLGEEGMPAIVSTILDDDGIALQAYLDAGLDPNSIVQDKLLLEYAIEDRIGITGCLQILLENGADLYLKGPNGMSVFDMLNDSWTSTSNESLIKNVIGLIK